LQPVRPAVVLGDLGPVARRTDAEHAAEGNVGDVEIAGAVEARPLEEAVELQAGGIGVGPARLPLLAELLRQPRELGGRPGLGHPVHQAALTSRSALSARPVWRSAGTVFSISAPPCVADTKPPGAAMTSTPCVISPMRILPVSAPAPRVPLSLANGTLS